MTWPAIYNRYPLLYPDSITYIADGRPVARALFRHEFSAYYGMRSFFYSLGILPFYRIATLWAVVALQAVIAAWVLWLVARSIVPRRTQLWYLAIVAALSLITSVSWYASLIMPDILGPVLYLCIYLLVFADETLSPAERVIVAMIAWWAVASHATHLMVAIALCVFLAILWAIFQSGFMLNRLKAIGGVAIIIVLAAVAQLGLHNYLYGEPSLNGDRPPFLMVRLIADGPGRWYLEQHCGEAKFARFAMCNHVRDLDESPDQFLWGEDGVWQNSSREEQKRILQEEVAFALATLRTYPRAVLARSAANFWNQLITFDLGFEANDWVGEEFDRALPGQKSQYLRSRQVRDELPLVFFSTVEDCVAVVSLLVIVLLSVWFWRTRSSRLMGLAVVVVPALVVNALVTGTLSMVENRYQSRVIWLLPLLAALLVLDWNAHRKAA